MEAAIYPSPMNDMVLTWSCKGLWDRVEMNRPGCLAGKLLVMYGQAKLWERNLKGHSWSV